VVVAKPEWGTKRICLNCSAKFYDLAKDPITCPSCGATFKTDDFTRGRRSKTTAVVEKPVPKPKPKPKRPVASGDDDDADDVLLGDDDDDDDLDDDDVNEVVVGVGSDDDDDKTV
jgi:uncharacterized protein (TIGR02300 family)